MEIRKHTLARTRPALGASEQHRSPRACRPINNQGSGMTGGSGGQGGMGLTWWAE